MFETVFQNLLEAVVMGVAMILATVAVMGLRLAVGYIRSKLSVEQFEFLRSGATTTVRFLEQLGTFDAAVAEGAKKKERALLMLAGFAEDHDIPVTYDLLDAMIEEAVNVMNGEVKPVLAELAVEASE